MNQQGAGQQSKKLSTTSSHYEVNEVEDEPYMSISTSKETIEALYKKMTELKSSPTRIIRVPEVLNRIGTSRTHLYRLIKANKFPAPVKLSEKLIGFYEHEVEEYLAALSTKGGK